MAELLPCPFCGSAARIAKIISREGELRGDAPSWDVQCSDCWLWLRTDAEAEALAAWNTRAPVPQSVEVRDRLEKVVESIAEEAIRNYALDRTDFSVARETDRILAALAALNTSGKGE